MMRSVRMRLINPSFANLKAASGFRHIVDDVIKCSDGINHFVVCVAICVRST